MTKTRLFVLLFTFVLFSDQNLAQVNYTANDLVQPYTGYFHPSANIGEYPSFSQNTLAELAAGNRIIDVPGVGVKALRPGLFESYLEVAGYQASVPTFQFYESLGMNDHLAIIGFPSPEHQEAEEFCPGFRSELFANIYEPIWDGGENGTPVNEDNYFALYMWKMVSEYKDYVRFWEIWNEPGFDYTGGLGFLPPGAPGNWWDNNPNPCDYKLRAPIFHYVRLLRISWEIIKAIDPDGYVVVSGVGYASFLDAILRNTDNPADGSINNEYPLRGGAYFDVMGFHSYPHFDGSLQEWSDQLNDWIYYRHSDAAAQGLVRQKDIFQEVLTDYGYDGAEFPEKLWMITEVNLPRKQFGEFIGSDEAQRNFMIKAVTTAMMNDFLQLHIFKLAEDTYFDNAYSEFDLMGLYERLDYNDEYFQKMTQGGIAHKTASDFLFGKRYDPDRTVELNFNDDIKGGAFVDENGNYTYVMWAETKTDQSEEASAAYTFPQGMISGSLIKYNWDAGISKNGEIVAADNIPLSGTPRFFVEGIFALDHYAGCVPLQVQASPQVQNVVNYAWTVRNDGDIIATSNSADPTFFFGAKGTYEIEMTAFDGSGQVMASQQQLVYVKETPDPAFDFEVSGPIAHFQNLSPFGNHEFTWDFGDGTTSNDPVPTHVYLNSGNYTVTLTATTECGDKSTVMDLTANSPQATQLTFTANDTIPVFTGKFRPGISWDFVNGWTEEQLADLTAGNLSEGVKGVGVKSLRTFVGESLFIDQGYDFKTDLFDHYHNIDLKDNTYLLAFPSTESRDPYFYCPDQQSTIFRDLYLEIWDNGENGTPINDDNPWAAYVYNTVLNYGPFVKYWEIYNSPDFDLTGERGWLPPGEPGNWWENNPDPCEYELRAPIFYYIRTLRVAYEIIKYLEPEDYVTIAGIAFPSFLDAICRNTDNPINGSISGPYPLKGGAYFDAVGFKSYPHFDGSTIFFDPTINNFAYERHSDAAVSGIKRVKQEFEVVLENYGYNGQLFPPKEFTISEANIPRRQLAFYLGGDEPQRNWTIKSWVEAVRNNIRQLNFFRLAESSLHWQAVDPFQVMGFYQVLNGTLPYEQTANEQGIALKTCSDFLFGTNYNQQESQALMLPDSIDGAAFQDAEGNLIYVLWAKTAADFSEQAAANYSFPGSLNIGQLRKFEWDYSESGVFEIIDSENVQLTGAPVFLTAATTTITPPVAAFEVDTQIACEGSYFNFSSISSGEPVNLEWTFEGGIPNSHFGENPPPILYQNPGVFSVRLKVDNAAGEHEFALQDYITVEGLPEAEFTFIMNGATVQFENLSTNATTYEWCFGDGTCITAESPTYVYFQNGTYTAQLTASSSCGTNTVEETFTIGAPPTADFLSNYTGTCDIPQVILIDFSYSNPDSWSWIIPGGDPSTSDLQFPTIDFPSGGEYEVTFVAGNDFGTDTITKTIYVEGPIEKTFDITLCEGDTYNGMQVFEDTTVVMNLSTQNLGCDSTVTAHINITEEVGSSFFAELCEGEILNGIVLTQDTILTETLTSSSGCDSLITIEVTVFQEEETFIMEEIDWGDSIVIGGQVFTDAGMYDILLSSANGCDSLIHLDLTVLTDIDEKLKSELDLSVYPNPFSESLQIEFKLSQSEWMSIQLFDVNGRLIDTYFMEKLLSPGKHRFRWDSMQVSSNVYLLKITTLNDVFVKKVVRM
ncbi:MAG: PKD domain-containing protein [Bacteroidota bacterium]